MKSLALRSFSMIFAMLMLSVFSVSVSAQDATPSADNSPNPEECTYEQRTMEELQALVGTPAPAGAGEAASAAFEATPVEVTLPSGTPADDATVAGVTVAIRGSIACYNAGDYLASFSGTTDEFIVVQVGLMLFDEDFVAAMEAESVAFGRRGPNAAARYSRGHRLRRRPCWRPR